MNPYHGLPVAWCSFTLDLSSSVNPVITFILGAILNSVESNSGLLLFFFFSIIWSVIGPENPRLSLNQSDAKLNCHVWALLSPHWTRLAVELTLVAFLALVELILPICAIALFSNRQACVFAEHCWTGNRSWKQFATCWSDPHSTAGTYC